MTPGRRLALALFLAAYLGYAIAGGLRPELHRTDFDYYWVGGIAAAARESPYTVADTATVGGRELNYPYYYPGPAALLLAPITELPLRTAFVIWSALGIGFLTYGVTGMGWWRLGILLSAPTWVSLVYGQTGALTTAAAMLPWLGFVYAAKPSIGLALWVAWPSRVAIAVSLALVLVSLAWLPTWPWEWWANVADSPYHLAPVERPLGWILLAGWLKWRDPGGRLLGSLAVIPHTPSMYELIPLLLVARSGRELALLLGLGWLAYYGIYTYTVRDGVDVVKILEAQWPYTLTLCYLPALALVVRRV